MKSTYKPLAEHRTAVLGMTLSELASKHGVKPQFLCQIENGYFHFWSKHRAKYAAIYGLTLEAYEEKVTAAQEAREQKASVRSARESA